MLEKMGDVALGIAAVAFVLLIVLETIRYVFEI